MSGKDEEPPKRVIVQVKRSRRLGIDLTLTPRYWLPNARNGRLVFTSRIYEFKNGKWSYPGEARKITFSFKEVSKENGICMNFPKKDKSNTNPDLFFADDDDKMKGFDFGEDETDKSKEKRCPTEILRAKDNPSHRHHYLKATTKKPMTEATVTVRCEDYGAFGVLQAIAPDCETIPPRERDAEPSEGIGPNDIKIPKDDNGNNIADCARSWDNVSLDKYGDGSDAPADEDEDDTPHADDHKGDGLTNYEEYRGFIVKEKNVKKHKRTNINRKDIFIYDRDGLGRGFFNQSRLVLHFIPDPDFYNGNSTDSARAPDAGTQVINFNSGHATGGEQHGLRLVNETLGTRVLGQTHGGPGLPKDINRVAINRKLCNHQGNHVNTLNSTIAHELGHAVNVWHHGEVSDFRTNPPTSKILPLQYLDNNGNPYDVEADGPHGVSSGVVNCIMRYNSCYYLWYYPDTSNPGSYFVNRNTNRDPGTVFCSSAVGNQCNDVVGFRNDASNDTWTNMQREPTTRGNCRSQIKVKDW